MHWVKQLQEIINYKNDYVVITVVAVKGSTPCSVGDKIMYNEQSMLGSIGGGNLEFQSLIHAKQLLTQKIEKSEVKKYALGPSLGQCCGGYVKLMFEFFSKKNKLSFVSNQQLKTDFILITYLTDNKIIKLTYCQKNGLSDNTFDTTLQNKLIQESKQLLKQNYNSVKFESYQTDLDDQYDKFCFESFLNSQLQAVAVFGAGHICRSLIPLIDKLPVNIYWIDDREKEFKQYPNNTDNINIICDDFVDAIEQLPEQCYCLVISYSHQIDFNICQKLLSKNIFSYLGLIGSKTKKNLFSKRLENRGFSNKQINKIICPIGIKNHFLKSPLSIAISIAMDLINFLDKKHQITV